MTTRFRSNSKASTLLFFCSFFLCSLPGILSSGVVKLVSIQIFSTHEWISAEPTVYFRCQGENITYLPDVKKTHFLYSFKGEESWQPMTELSDKKCKRCGLYEKDTIESDDVFDEWEICPSDFTAPDGKYIHIKDKEFNATFLCPKCIPLETGSNHSAGSHTGMGKVILVILISILVSSVCIVGSVAVYKYWQRKRREQDQARFLKLFEDDDELEEELELGHVI